MEWISPSASLEVRSDPAGYGHFGAKRGARTHNGVDLTVWPGQYIVSPTECIFERISNPYKTDSRWHGLKLLAEQYEIFVWYMQPYWFRRGERLRIEERIGVAQDIVEKYGFPMTPHIHFGVKENGIWIDPMPLITDIR